MTGTWQFWAFLAAGFAALTAIFAKLGVTAIPPDQATLIRTVIITILLVVMVVTTGQWQPLDQLDGRAIIMLVLSALATGASWLCYFRALSLGDASRVAPIDKLSVVFVAIIAALFLGEKLSLAGWLGVGLIAAGAILIAL